MVRRPQPLGLSAWELVCQASATFVAAGQLPSSVDRECPPDTASGSPIGHATGTPPFLYHLGAAESSKIVARSQRCPATAKQLHPPMAQGAGGGRNDRHPLS